MLVSYEAIRYWCQKFRPSYSRTLGRKQGRLGGIWHVDELFITIHAQRRYLWRAVDQDGDVIEILVTKRDHGPDENVPFWTGLDGTRTAPKLQWCFDHLLRFILTY